eukprot:scaffold160949_cov42-Prasinocladus_malaysianus.AAC.1
MPGQLTTTRAAAAAGAMTMTHQIILPGCKTFMTTGEHCLGEQMPIFARLCNDDDDCILRINAEEAPVQPAERLDTEPVAWASGAEIMSFNEIVFQLEGALEDLDTDNIQTGVAQVLGETTRYAFTFNL